MDPRDFLALARRLSQETTEAADYDFSRYFSQTACQNLTSKAAKIIRVLESAALEPTRTLITDAMKIYERDVLKDVTWHP